MGPCHHTDAATRTVRPYSFAAKHSGPLPAQQWKCGPADRTLGQTINEKSKAHETGQIRHWQAARIGFQ